MELKTVDVSHLHSPADIQTLIENVDLSLERDGWKNPLEHPEFQTTGELFERPWGQKFGESFLYGCAQVLGGLPRKRQVRSWCYKTNHQTWSDWDPEELWHEHGDSLAGLLYLYLPDGSFGTEFKNPAIPDIVPKYLTWHFFPGNELHRPKEPGSSEWRYVLAADMFDLSVWPFSPTGEPRKGR